MSTSFHSPWVARAYVAAGRDLDMLERAVAFLRKHYGIDKPGEEDVKWAADYIAAYDRQPSPEYVAA